MLPGQKQELYDENNKHSQLTSLANAVRVATVVLIQVLHGLGRWPRGAEGDAEAVLKLLPCSSD